MFVQMHVRAEIATDIPCMLHILLTAHLSPRQWMTSLIDLDNFAELKFGISTELSQKWSDFSKPFAEPNYDPRSDVSAQRKGSAKVCQKVKSPIEWTHLTCVPPPVDKVLAAPWPPQSPTKADILLRELEKHPRSTTHPLPTPRFAYTHENINIYGRIQHAFATRNIVSPCSFHRCTFVAQMLPGQTVPSLCNMLLVGKMTTTSRTMSATLFPLQFSHNGSRYSTKTRSLLLVSSIEMR